MEIICPNCGQPGIVAEEPSLGQHLLCPFCDMKFSYGVSQPCETANNENHMNNRLHAIVESYSEDECCTIKRTCPHCGAEDEVDSDCVGAVAVCEICHNKFVVQGVDAYKSVVIPRHRTLCSKTMRHLLAGCAVAMVIALAWFVITVMRGVEKHNKVQLWEGGPYWAETNIGAKEPWEHGSYFWWGDTVGHNPRNGVFSFLFNSTNTPTCNKSNAVLESDGWIMPIGDAYVLTSEHDAAHVQWGGDWRMPTLDELSDLVNQCVWTWTTIKGINGFLIRGQGDYASASIFLPASGNGGGTSIKNAGRAGLYWASDPYSKGCFEGFSSPCLSFEAGIYVKVEDSSKFRFVGMSIRAVQGGEQFGRTARLSGAATTIRRNGMHNKVQLWNGGPYWAETNIGAEEPWEHGLYFWWGDTLGHRSENGAFNFTFDIRNAPTYDKQISSLQRDGWVVPKDGTYILVPGHDAAYVQWGSGWRMPTADELSALNDKCDWIWTTKNCVYGCIVRGRGDYACSSIFLPASGLSVDDAVSVGKNGFYWSSVPVLEVPAVSSGLFLHSCNHGTDGLLRCFGQSIRPVQGVGE